MSYLLLRGSDFTGSEGVGRTYTISILSIVANSIDVRQNNNILIPETDFTYSSSTNILTLNTYLSDSEYITLFYSTSTEAATGNQYTTAELVQAELRASTAFTSSTTPTLATINIWINEASRIIDSISGTVYGSTEYTEYFDYEGSDRIQLRNSPIISISSIAENTASAGETASWDTQVSETDYLLYENKGEILVVPGKWSPKDGYKNIKIVYTAGYSSIPAKVQMLATKMVTQRVLSSLISSNVEEGNDGGSISVGSISIVEPASYGVNSYKQLKTDIEDLKKELISGFVVLRY
jgi:hypothetical protein